MILITPAFSSLADELGVESHADMKSEVLFKIRVRIFGIGTVLRSG